MVDALPAGSRILAEDLSPWSTAINQSIAPGWTNFTPAWANTSTAPAIGNGSWAGTRYRRPAGADLVHVEMCLTWGSTTSAGTGAFWTFGFPSVTPDATELTDCQGVAWLEDVSTSARRFWHAFAIGSSGVILSPEAGTGFATVGVPWTWATGDKVKARYWYKPA